MAPEFLLPAEVQEITRLRDPTRRRMETRGLFPQRIRIAPRRIAWRRADIEQWVKNPEDWQYLAKGIEEPCDDLAEDL
jgi:prophage regulatory protein